MTERQSADEMRQQLVDPLSWAVWYLFWWYLVRPVNPDD